MQFAQSNCQSCKRGLSARLWIIQETTAIWHIWLYSIAPLWYIYSIYIYIYIYIYVCICIYILQFKSLGSVLFIKGFFHQKCIKLIKVTDIYNITFFFVQIHFFSKNPEIKYSASQLFSTLIIIRNLEH